MVKKSNSCGSNKKSNKNNDNLMNMVDKVWPQTKKELEEVAHKVWPKTKKELENGLKQTKELLAKGEKYLKEFSDKSIKNTKKLSLNLKKEKLYYDLGKTMSKITKEMWGQENKGDRLVKEIKSIEREIRRIK